MRSEHAVRLARPKLIFADHELIQHDFPQLRDERVVDEQPALRALPPERRGRAIRSYINNWVLGNAAWISRAQLAAAESSHAPVSSPPEVMKESQAVHRPARYGRAFVTRAAGRGAEEGAGLLDLKGVGVGEGSTPDRALHGNGLMQLGEALRDTAMQWLVEAVLVHAGSTLETVPLYALIDPGFDVVTTDGRRVPAGVQVRRAHRRALGGIELPQPGSDEEFIKFEVEMLLRHYGVTSCNNGTLLLVEDLGDRLQIRYGEHPPSPPERFSTSEMEIMRRLCGLEEPRRGASRRFDCVNVQLAREVALDPSRAQLVDFGSYGTKSRFSDPVLNPVSGRPLRWGGFLSPSASLFPQPDPSLSVEFDGMSHSAPWDLARRYREGELTAAQLIECIAAPVQRTLNKWCRVSAPDGVAPKGRSM